MHRLGGVILGRRPSTCTYEGINVFAFLLQAFGVGALEDEDEDVYTTDAMSNYDQTMELDDSEQFFGWTAPGSRKGKGKKGQLLCLLLLFSLFFA